MLKAEEVIAMTKKIEEKTLEVDRLFETREATIAWVVRESLKAFLKDIIRKKDPNFVLRLEGEISDPSSTSPKSVFLDIRVDLESPNKLIFGLDPGLFEVLSHGEKDEIPRNAVYDPGENLIDRLDDEQVIDFADFLISAKMSIILAPVGPQ